MVKKRLHMQNKDTDQLRSDASTARYLCFTKYIVPAIYFLNQKFQAAILLRLKFS